MYKAKAMTWLIKEPEADSSSALKAKD